MTQGDCEDWFAIRRTYLIDDLQGIRHDFLLILRNDCILMLLFLKIILHFVELH